MQHIVSLVQLGVLRSVRAGGVLHRNTPPARISAYKPETCRAKINKYLHQVGN